MSDEAKRLVSMMVGRSVTALWQLSYAEIEACLEAWAESARLAGSEAP